MFLSPETSAILNRNRFSRIITVISILFAVVSVVILFISFFVLPSDTISSNTFFEQNVEISPDQKALIEGEIVSTDAEITPEQRILIEENAQDGKIMDIEIPPEQKALIESRQDQ